MTDTWRIIDSGYSSAAHNMALDEAIAVAIRNDNSPPTLRLYGWDMPSLSIGCFQKLNSIDVDYCMEHRIPVVRRPTGGRAILHNHELTYSFSARTESGRFSKGLFDSYKKINSAIHSAISRVGISSALNMSRETHQAQIIRCSKSPVCFHSLSYGEITINNRKVVGSAQKRWTNGFLQQGSIPYELDKKEMLKIFRMKTIQEIDEKMIGLKDVKPHLQHNELKNAFAFAFEETFDVRLISSSPSQEEILLAQDLMARKYFSHWLNFKR